MFKRILVPTDGTAASMAAIDAAIGFAHASGAQVVGLHVTPLHPVTGEVPGTPAGPGSEDRTAELLGHVERRAAQAGVSAMVQSRRADAPSEATLETARDLHCDLIVMGSRGRGPARPLPLGSQTLAVLAHSPVPVMVVPGQDASFR